MKTINLREKIAKNVCRTILWIDDEIKPSDDARERMSYDVFFKPIVEEFSNNGMLCHLQYFPPIRPGNELLTSEKELEMCKALAQKADVIILDWHLGIDDPSHSISIIESLIDSGGTRFVVVLSQDPKLVDSFTSNFDAFFSSTDNSGWYSNNKGQFICLLKKSDFKHGNGSTLLEKIYEQLVKVYPDYLHWAALEIAGRIKEFTPAWLANLPNPTDLGVLAERLHSTEDVGHTIFENLLEDLKGTIDFSSMESLCYEEINPEKWLYKEEYCRSISADIERLKSEGKNDLVDKMKTLIPFSSEEISTPKEIGKTYKKIIAEVGHLSSIERFNREIHAFGEFCEIKSVKPKLSIKRGSIIQFSNKNDEIWVCISQSCDCLRKPNLLFVRGEKIVDTNGKDGETFLRFRNDHYVFKSSADNMCSFAIQEEPRIPQHAELIGNVREGILTRLTARYWNYATRVGVNQPLFLRELRKEKP